MNILIQEPRALFLLPVLVALVVFLVRRDFVSFSSRKQQAEYESGLGRRRIVVAVLRVVVFALLVIALSQPAVVEQRIVPGDPSLKLLVDNSRSFELFDSSVAGKLKSQLEQYVPVSVVAIADNRSAIGDGVLNSLQGNDNVLLVTDGNSDYGRELADIMLLASMLNSTVSSVELEPVKDDTSAAVLGPSETTADVENEFSVRAVQVGKERSYLLEVLVDGEQVVQETFSGSQDLSFKQQLSEGFHRIEARVTSADYFPQNNVFYKSVKVQPKPKVLLVSYDSPLNALFSGLYDLEYSETMPSSISGYAAVIINNEPLSNIGSVDVLSDYVVDGNGLVVIGGKRSFDRTNYRSQEYKVYEALLPVVVGKGGEQQRKDVNVVLVIDISGSTGGMFNRRSTSTVEEIEKALALGILGDIKKTDNVAVIAVNTDAYVISELNALSPKYLQLRNDVERLSYVGGTDLSVGIRRASELLQSASGSKNIIVLSDGLSAVGTEDIRASASASFAGIHVYAVGVGEQTDSGHMQDIAAAGKGSYFEPTEMQRIKILFGDSEDAVGEAYGLQVLDAHHFITERLELGAIVNGFNFVVPKPSATMLVSTSQKDPILTVWRFGLGRVAVLSTDDGSAWAGDLLNQRNSKVMSRMINWAVGDLGRNKAFDVRVKDVYLGEPVRVDVKSSELPESDLGFSKVGQNLYSASFTPKSTGFYTVLGAVVAVNYDREYSMIGFNPGLSRLVEISGGKMFKPEQVKEIVEKVRQDSRRVDYKRTSYAWPLLLAALVLFLVDVAYRRLEKLK